LHWLCKCSGETAEQGSGHGSLVEEIKSFLGEFESSSVSHVRRSGSKVAKEGCTNKISNVWVDVLPEFVMDLMALDAGVQ
jgi:hypothetical protein